MEHIFFLKGMVIGFAIAAPVGPVGVLCVNRTLSQGRLHGFVSGLGAVTGDIFYAVVAAFGIRVISSFVNANSTWLRAAGGIFLAALGIKIYFSKPELDRQDQKGGFLENYLSALAITFSNPVTLVAFGAVFAALGLGGPLAGNMAPFAIVGGILAGSTLCWFLLSYLVSAVRTKFDTNVLKIFNRVSAVILTVFSVIVLLSIAGYR